ncbi:MAG: addiction module antitoxin RelB [Sulfobacillus benefaciens]|uniref:Addiction module antitoxin RelB n=1 Tax=Sulfobacillus benefaciens TaxID=453960 RepID=A0A2T2XM03_9FIRM|nr:MAG: addiction module antitoxin RelB [Sulfobacillus benefaciens]
MTHDELEVELRKLDPRERARLAAALLDSLEELSEDENARLWAEEAVRRHDDLRSDVTLGRSATDVFRDSRQRLGG